MHDGYKLAFDIADRPLLDGGIAPLFILPVVGLLLVAAPRSVLERFIRMPKGPLGALFSWFFFLFSSAVLGFWLIGHLTQAQQLRAAERDAGYRVAEGCLEKFHPMPASGHDTERLELAGKYFEYSDYIDTAGFNRSESHGGGIHADSRVRLDYVGGDIIRVETQDHACPRAPDLPRQELPGGD